MSQAHRIPEDAEIRLNGIRALNEALGPTLALRFLSLIHRDRTDYVQVSEQLYGQQSVDQIFERARESWKQQAGDQHPPGR
jgi:hypothetical protein